MCYLPVWIAPQIWTWNVLTKSDPQLLVGYKRMIRDIAKFEEKFLKDSCFKRSDTIFFHQQNAKMSKQTC